MLTLSFEHPDAQPISGSFSFLIEDGWYFYYSNLELVDCHLEKDREAMLLRLAKFAEAGVDRRLLRKLFNISRSTLQRAVNKFRERGEHPFLEPPPRKTRGVSSIVGKTKEKAERLLAGGKPVQAVAKMLNVPRGTLYHNLRKGFLRPDLAERTAPANAAGGKDDGMVGRGTRDRLDREASMGRGARDTKRRVQASKGELKEAKPRFDKACSAVPFGGTLLAFPPLVEEGLLKAELAFRFREASSGSRPSCCIRRSGFSPACRPSRSSASCRRAKSDAFSGWTAPPRPRRSGASSASSRRISGR